MREWPGWVARLNRRTGRRVCPDAVQGATNDVGYDLGPVPIGQVRAYVIETAVHLVTERSEPAGPQIGDLESAADHVVLIGAGDPGVDGQKTPEVGTAQDSRPLRAPVEYFL